MNTKLLAFIILGAVLIGVALWQLVDFNVSEQEIPAPIKTAPAPGTSEAESAPLTQSFTIEGDEFSFSPASISVKRGATVELTFKNIGKAPHNYIIDELGLRTKTIGGGKTDVVSFAAPDIPGAIRYASYCSVPGHREAGMEGTIEIK